MATNHAIYSRVSVVRKTQFMKDEEKEDVQVE